MERSQNSLTIGLEFSRTFRLIVHVLDICAAGLIRLVVIRVIKAIVLRGVVWVGCTTAKHLKDILRRRFLAYNQHHRHPW